MHILALLGAVITFIAVWYWRLKIMKDVAEDGRKLAETALNLPRKLRNQQTNHPRTRRSQQ